MSLEIKAPDCYGMRLPLGMVIYSVFPAFQGGGLAGTRTQDQRLKRPLLYRLSYQPTNQRQHAELQEH